jgi:putative transposase
VAKQEIFRDIENFNRLLTTFSFYLESTPTTKLSTANNDVIAKLDGTTPKKPLVLILGYCLMPNHFHLIAKQLVDGGIQKFMRHSLNSYVRYYNTKYDRVGTIFQGKFKDKIIEDSEQLMHLSRYIHLNPFVSKIVDEPEKYPWSSYNQYLKNKKGRLCSPKIILELFDSTQKYRDFVDDYSEYARSLADLRDLILD